MFKFADKLKKHFFYERFTMTIIIKLYIYVYKYGSLHQQELM